MILAFQWAPRALAAPVRSYHSQRMPKYRLNSGLEMPAVGLGTWKSRSGEVRAAVQHALCAGYRHVDCAAVYKNEAEVGQAIADAVHEGTVRREDLFITSKLWNSRHRADEVHAACSETIRALQVEYLDLYLIHWPVTDVEAPVLTPPISETWAAMEDLVRAGVVRSIGVANFSAKKLRALCDIAALKPAVNQVELHPMLRQEHLLAEADSLGVHLTAYSPLGSPDSAALFNREGLPLLEHPVVTAVAARLGRDPGQVLVRWALQRGTSVIPKSVTPSRIESNLDVLAWELSSEDMADLGRVEPQRRMLDGRFFVKPGGPYRSVGELWDEPLTK